MKSGLKELRPYQGEAVSKILDSVRRGMKPLYVLSMGGGKTVVMSRVMESLASGNDKILVISHRKEILHQIYGELKGVLGVERVGLVVGSTKFHEKADVLVMSISMTTGKYGKALLKSRSFRYIVVDEAHRSKGNSYVKLLNDHELQLDVGGGVIGFTATPVRLDGKGLGDIFNEMICGPGVEDLIKMGYLCSIKTYVGKELDLSGVKKRMGDYSVKSLSEYMQSSGGKTLLGDMLDSYDRYLKPLGLPIVVACVDLRHVREVYDTYVRHGVRVAMLDGGMSDTERDKVIEACKNLELDVVVQCDILTEGTDIPALGGVQVLRPTKSLRFYMQLVGRIARLFKGKKFGVCVDHTNNTITFGPAGINRTWDLSGNAKATPKRTYKINQIESSGSRLEGDYMVGTREVEIRFNENSEMVLYDPLKFKEDLENNVFRKIDHICHSNPAMPKYAKLRGILEGLERKYINRELFDYIGERLGYKKSWGWFMSERMYVYASMKLEKKGLTFMDFNQKVDIPYDMIKNRKKRMDDIRDHVNKELGIS